MKRVIVCDSGLGGLNIAARFFTGSAAGREPCEVVYFNAYPDPGCGFNKLGSDREQEELFREVLEGMKKFSPDLCLIACNTLSIVYGRLKKWYTPAFEVAGIVEAAVGGMADVLHRDPAASMLILGTKSTVESGAYARKLIAAGIAPERIKGLACPGLATLLESDPAAPEVQQDIAGYAAAAAALFDTPPPRLFCALCCTHFGFARKIWENSFAGCFPGFGGVVDLNDLFGMTFTGSSFSYHAKIGFFPGARENMSLYFEKTAPAVSAALKCAVPEPDLFRFTTGKK